MRGAASPQDRSTLGGQSYDGNCPIPAGSRLEVAACRSNALCAPGGALVGGWSYVYVMTLGVRSTHPSRPRRAGKRIQHTARLGLAAPRGSPSIGPHFVKALQVTGDLPENREGFSRL